MKKPNFRSSLELGAVLALALALGSSVTAGPGPQYWTQMEKIRAENATKSTVAKTTTPSPVMACPACKTTAIRVFHPAGAAGKIPARYDTIGSKHTCDACGGGAIATVHGKTTNEMKTNCAICAKEKSACCLKTS